jgi:GNAT superfamily N-acetyltransferase
MGLSVEYRSMKPGEENQVIELVSRVFHQFVAPLYSEDGVAEFMKYLDPSRLADRAKGDSFVRVAESNNQIIGVIAVKDGSHIALFFVSAEHQGKGIGRKLLSQAVQKCISNNPDLTWITVNSSPNAVAVYRRLGFRETSEERTVNGIRHVPMALEVTLDMRSLQYRNHYESENQYKGRN